jgi:hypothetical protein
LPDAISQGAKRENARVEFAFDTSVSCINRLVDSLEKVSVFIDWPPALKTRIQHSWLFSVVVGCFLETIETHHRSGLDAIVDGPNRCFFNRLSVASPRLMLPFSSLSRRLASVLKPSDTATRVLKTFDQSRLSRP